MKKYCKNLFLFILRTHHFGFVFELNCCSSQDELQRDLMQERWDLVEGYPNQLRSYVPIFTAYTDSAFPTEIPTDQGLRVALRYEVGRFFASCERLRQATNRKSLDEGEIVFIWVFIMLQMFPPMHANKMQMRI